MSNTRIRMYTTTAVLLTVSIDDMHNSFYKRSLLKIIRVRSFWRVARHGVLSDILIASVKPLKASALHGDLQRKKDIPSEHGILLACAHLLDSLLLRIENTKTGA